MKKNHMEDLTRIFSLEEVDVLFKSVDQFGHEGIECMFFFNTDFTLEDV